MKSIFTTLLFLVTIISLAQQNQDHWKSELDFGNGTIFSTTLKVEKTDDQVIMSSPKNADVRMFGYFKAKLGRALGKMPKKGILLKINTNKIGDSLYGVTKIPVFGELIFRGILSQNHLSGEFIKNDTLIIGTLKGIKSDENKKDYSSLFSKTLEITHNNIYSKKNLQTKQWSKFQKKLKKLFNKSQDDLELYLGFNILSSKLPFSHYNLFIGDFEYDRPTSEADEIVEVEPTILFEEKNKTTAYLKIKNFSSSTKELSFILPKIVESNYQNLIIDLRNNGGGGIEAAFELAKYIVNEDIEIGYFVTNKLEYSGFQPNVFKTLPELQPKTSNEFGNDLKTGKGGKLIFKKPANSIFSGNLYILTNPRTGSTCEPIVYALKKNNWATIIGENTAGAMLAASPFKISGKYYLMQPIADFYTFDGVRLEGNGVSPDITTTSENALIKALEIINVGDN